jgi:hypothetical protein
MEKVSAAYIVSSSEDEEVTSSQEEEEVKTAFIPFCEVCKEKEHKYRCPRCEMLTCSL